MGFSIAKVEESANGDVFVLGKATDDTIDTDDQIIDAEFARKGLSEWLASGANVRVMHSASLYPAGVGLELEDRADGSQWLKAEVVEPTAKLLVKKGVLRAFSVGISRPKIVRDARARGGRVTGGVFSEVSLVDRPANKNCTLTLCKRAIEVSDGNPSFVPINALDASDQLLKSVLADLTKHDMGPGDQPPHGHPSDDDTCSDCKGSGSQDGNTCPTCGGNGKASSGKGKFGQGHDDHDADDNAGNDSDYQKAAKEAINTRLLAEIAKANDARDLLSGQFSHPRGPVTGGPTTSHLDLSQTVETTLTPVPNPSDPTAPETDAGATWDRTALRPGHQSLEAHGEPVPPAEKADADLAAKAAAAAAKWGAEIAAAQAANNLTITTDTSTGGVVMSTPTPTFTYGTSTPGVQWIGAPTTTQGWNHGDSTFIPSYPGELPTPVQKNLDSEANRASAAFALKRLHDATCPVYSWSAVTAEYPAIDLSTVFSASTADTLYKVLSYSVDTDAGSGTHADDIAHIAKAMGSLLAFLSAEGFSDEATADILTFLRSDIHKDFLVANGLPVNHHEGGAIMDEGSEVNIPRPCDPPTPGQFRRGPLRSETASSGQHPTWPSGSHQPDADDFDREAITAGHARTSPASKAAQMRSDGETYDTIGKTLGVSEDEAINLCRVGVEKNTAAELYDSAMVAASASALADLHTHISSVMPHFCRLGITPEPLLPSAHGSVPAGGDVALIPDETRHAAQTKITANVPELVKMAAAEIADDLTATLRSENAALVARIEQLEGAPAAIGPNIGVVAKRRISSSTAAEGPNESGQNGDNDEMDATLGLLKRYAHGSDPNMRALAISRLEKMGKADLIS